MSRRPSIWCFIVAAALHPVGVLAQDQTPHAVIAAEYAAIDRHDLDGVFAVYADPVRYGTLQDSVPPVLTSVAQLRAAFAPVLAQNPQGHVWVVREMDVGRFVVAREQLLGTADGKPFELLDVSEVRGGKVVAELESDNIAQVPASVSRDAAATVARVDSAFARQDPDAAVALFVDPAPYYVWGDTAIRRLSRAKLRDGYRAVLTANPGMHYAIVDRVVSGPYVVAHETLSGLNAHGQQSVLDALVISEVRDGHIVARWETPWLRRGGSHK
jgi:hypothetical protein